MNQGCLKLKVETSTGLIHRRAGLHLRSWKPLTVQRKCSLNLNKRRVTSQLVTKAAVSVTSPPAETTSAVDEATFLSWRRDFYERYEYVRKLNAGSFGKVWLARDLATGESVAVKEISKKRGRLTPERVQQKVEQEVAVMQHLEDCPLVVGLKGCYVEDEEFLIVMELCEGEDVKLHVAENGPVPEQLAAAIALEILKVIRACHDKNFVHGDIKTANFMLKSPKCNPFVMNHISVLQPGWLKAIDFGCTQIHQDGSARLRSRVGTPVYMAPEVFQRNFGKESDMWSLGVFLFQLMSGTFPFWRTSSEALMCSVQEVAQAVQTRPADFTNSPVWRASSSECKEFINGLLNKDYSERLTLDEAESHPFLARNLVCSSEGCMMLQSNNILQCDTNSIPIQA